MSKIVQFASFQSAVEAPFWHALAKKKLDVFQLSDDEQEIVGFYTSGQSVQDTTTGKLVEIPPRLSVSNESLEYSPHETLQNLQVNNFPAPGNLRNTNTIEDFKTTDKNMILKRAAENIWQSIISGEVDTQPMQFAHFTVLTYADLKKHKFYYWFSFPALLPSSPWVFVKDKGLGTVGRTFSTAEINSLQNAYIEYKSKNQLYGNSAFFLVKRYAATDKISIGSLSQWKEFISIGDTENVLLGFVDPSGLQEHPGWPLRNLLAYANVRLGLRKVQILCLRDKLAKNDLSSSLLVNVELPADAFYSNDGKSIPKFVGWEKSTTGKLAPRLADMAPTMDPARLADTAVDLNLKLMRWRLLPELQLEKIQSTKCLLLGSGTLGCYVARSLLGWGVRKITFVDYGKVSFSNPVRQPLFLFDDCLDGGAPKAHAAAANLRKVYPGVDATGIELSIPMPGHTITNERKVSQDVDQLRELIASHDVIYLLMDSRESRWLPTLLGAKMRKLVINAALGFDTFLVMRHGVRNTADVSGTLGRDSNQLGCYYCNDVVAPTDSLSDRTLDQQCTVTRPGLSSIASAIAVELMVSVLHHKLGSYAPADTEVQDKEPSSELSPLGILPHQIRGFLGHFNNMLIAGKAYDRCTACSETIIQNYEQDGFEFLKKAFNDPQYLEEVTGLAQMKRESEDMLNNDDWIDDDSEADEDLL
ncbi:hypothetical protein BGW37DRAFT_536498 [Umbelopsis sp. PMI_123]|nr:hypothetical protein BGW37DRAFT_536498 [Umbelopsis sp. PMI_123]